MSTSANESAGSEIVCEARREHLAELLAFVEQACVRADVEQDVLFDVRLAVEEVVTNVIEHAYAGQEAGPVTVRFVREPGRVVVTIEDLARPFDPATVPPVDPTAPLEARRIGGLGWHLVRRIMDEVRYERLSPRDNGHGNRVTLVKQLSTTN